MSNPTHTLKSLPVVAWQWTGDNEETCPRHWELKDREVNPFPFLIIDGIIPVRKREGIILMNNDECRFVSEKDLEDRFTPIEPQLTSEEAVKITRERSNKIDERRIALYQKEADEHTEPLTVEEVQGMLPEGWRIIANEKPTLWDDLLLLDDKRTGAGKIWLDDRIDKDHPKAKWKFWNSSVLDYEDEDLIYIANTLKTLNARGFKSEVEGE